MAPGKSLASLHAEVPDTADFVAIHEVVDEAEKAVWQKTGVFVVIHMDPVSVDDTRVGALREMTARRHYRGGYPPDHARFPLVDGDRQINLIFDVVAPYEYQGEKKDTLVHDIRRVLRARDKRYNAIITVDHQM